MTHRLGPRFDDALVFAHQLHREQVRKGSGVPYIAHLLAVASLVLEHGGDEEEAIAGLLHDALEDQGGQATALTIEARFGMRVIEIVTGCTDTMQSPKPPWRERKERYLASIDEKPTPVLRVSLADKVHNARSILSDYPDHGETLWQRFRGGKDGTLWYYESLAARYDTAAGAILLGGLRREFRQLVLRLLDFGS
jgi:(p)ppGpp synthase/HD superfamily hydrolase